MDELGNMIFKKKKEKLYKKASRVALENSKIIYDEAKLLNESGHSARGFALSIISLEESAKSFLLLLISLNITDERKTMGFVRNHDNKLLQSSRILSFAMKIAEIVLDLMMMEKDGKIQKIPKMNGYKKNVKEWSKVFEMIVKLHKTKLDSIYVDVRDNKIINPNTEFKKDSVAEITDIANMQITMIKSFVDMKEFQFLKMWKDPFASQLKIEHLLK